MYVYAYELVWGFFLAGAPLIFRGSLFLKLEAFPYFLEEYSGAVLVPLGRVEEMESTGT